MKKKLCALLFGLCLVSLTACGNKVVSDNVPASSQEEEMTENKNDKKNGDADQDELEKLEEIVTADVENTIASLETEYEKLVAEIDTYEKYLENTDKIEAFYEQVCEDTRFLCIRMREYSVDYANVVMSSDKPNDEKYDDLDELYDCIYDDAGDEIYDGIYSGILDDMYDDYYGGIVGDAYGDGVPYDEWSNTLSDEYDRWSDALSNVYDEWSECQSDVYGFWSDMKSALWKDDIEKAEKEIEDFQENIEKIKNKSNQTSDQEESSDDASEEDATTEDAGANEELIDGMRPEFKEAMDSYEEFYDEYCEVLKKYNANPSDMEVLVSYTDMLTKAVEVSEKFEAWEDNEMNDAELKYYMDVMNRVSKKLLELQ